MFRPFAPSGATFALLVMALYGYTASVDSTQCPFHLAATFSEDMITLSWPDVRDAAAFNVYADLGDGPVKANFSPVRSRNRFSFMWIETDGKKERVVKGKQLSLFVVPLFSNAKDNDTAYAEGRRSCTVMNSYFAGFSNVLDSGACRRILRPHTAAQTILTPSAARVTPGALCGRYGPLAHAIDAIYKSRIDPHDEGACVPFSTMVAKYFTANGIPCYRAQGMFINSFHSFNIIAVDSVEYVLDFTADQFVPKSAPVFIPVAWCFADSCGAPTGRPRGTFTKMYRVETVYASGQIAFTDTPKAREYQRLLDSLVAGPAAGKK
jgi:hypothetical protein